MIKLDLGWAITWYLFASMGVLLILWAWERLGYQRLVAQRSVQWRECAICAYQYSETIEEKLSQCPRCGSYNTVNREIANDKTQGAR